MIHNKHINKIVAAAVAVALIVTLLFISFSGSETASIGVTQQYEDKLFGKDIISLDIIAAQSDWDAMIENATAEEYIMVDVVINGTKFNNVGIRPKGNSSLSQVAQDSTTDRFSFRLKFDEYVKGQTCFGLDTFVVNNMIGDNSYMKEYLSYDILNYIGVDTPLYDFTDITVNGEVWGLYLAIEAYDDSYLSRVYGDIEGELYNVKSMDMGNIGDTGNTTNFDRPVQTENQGQTENPGQPGNTDQTGTPGQTGTPVQTENPRQTETPVQTEIPGQNGNTDQNDFIGGGMFGGMGGRGSSGGDLKYTDDNISSYSSIFDNVVGTATEEDQQKVVTALEKLSTATDLETYFDVDQILRYMAAHTVVVNLDSYSSSMAQNYYIYENDGKITILPWDYNFSFGGFQSSNASAVVNFPIDTPVSGVTLADRPLFDKLLANEEYKAKYHEYLGEIMTGYFADGKWEEKLTQLNTIIADEVKSDPTAFCTFEEYQKAVSTLTQLGDLRAESIIGQLEGTVPATTTAQSESPNELILAESIAVSDLGGSGMGGDRGGMGGQTWDKNSNSQGVPAGGFGNMTDMPDMAVMQKAMEIIQSANGESLTEELILKLTELGLTTEQITSLQSVGGNMGRGEFPNQNGGVPEGNTQNIKGNANLQNNIGQESLQGNQNKVGNQNNILVIGGLSIFLILATVFVAKYKKSY